MVTRTEQNRRNFIDSFNKAIGIEKGIPMSYENTAISHAGIDDATMSAVQKMLGKTVKKAATTKAKKKTTKKITVPNIKPTPLEQATSNFGLLDTKASGISTGGSGGGFLHELTHNPLTNFVGEQVVKPVARNTVGIGGGALIHPVETALDIVSRPAYGVGEALRNTTQSINEGEPVWSLGDDFVTGAWKGVSGEKKTGFGDVLHEAKYADTTKRSATGKALLWGLSQAGGQAPDPETLGPGHEAVDTDKLYKNNSVVKWADRASGAVGDIATDPTTYIFGGSKVVKAGAKSAEGLQGADLIKDEIGRVIKDVVDDIGDVRITKATVRKGGLATKGVSANEPVINKIIRDVQSKLDNFIVDTKNGKVIGGSLKDSHGTVAHLAAEATRDEYFRQLLPLRNKVLARLNQGLKFTDAELRKLGSKSPLANDWIETLIREAPKTKVKDPTKLIELIDREFSTTLDKIVNEVNSKLIGKLDDIVMRVPTISMMGKTHYMTSVGKYWKLAKKTPAGITMDNLTKAFRYTSWFPEHTANIAQKVRSLNYKRYDEFRKSVDALFEGTTKAERRTIHEAIQDRRQLTGHIGDLQNKVKEWYKEIYWEEVGAGARNPNTTPFADNYVFNQVKNSYRSKNIDAIRKLKKETVYAKGNIDGFTSKELLAKEGLRSETDAAQALLIRKTKSLRELSRGQFRKDLVTHYGIRARMSRAEAKLQGLVVVDRKKFPDAYKGIKSGELVYLDKDIDNVYKKYIDLTSLKATPESADLVRIFDKLTNFFKTANTIYFPGFHIRNLVSDIFMGAFDGVKSSDYSKIMKAMMNRENAYVAFGNSQIKFTDLLRSYYDNAASAGFFDTDLNKFTRTHADDLSTTGFMDSFSPSNIKHIPTAARSLSTKREDFGRLVHYYHALNDEYAHQIRKGFSHDKAIVNAEEAALDRVNKFKFDYNALTNTEQNIKRFGVPFYTYMRKAAPVLMEQLFMNPRYFSYINRLQQALAPDEEFRGARLPGWMEENAFSQLTGGNEPLGFADYLFPTRTLKEALSNPAGKANPIVQAPFEYATGKNIFTGRDLPKGKGDRLEEIIKSKYRGITTYRGIESDTKPTIEKWAGFFGIPLMKVTQARQAGKAYELQQELDTKVKNINIKIQDLGMRISIRDGKIFLVYPKSPSSFEERFGFKPKYAFNEKEDVVDIFDKFSDIDFSKYKKQN